MLTSNPALHAFLANEGNSGLRLVTAHQGGPPRFSAGISAIIAREAMSGYRPPDDPDLLADGIVVLADGGSTTTAIPR